MRLGALGIGSSRGSRAVASCVPVRNSAGLGLCAGVGSGSGSGSASVSAIAAPSSSGSGSSSGSIGCTSGSSGSGSGSDSGSGSGSGPGPSSGAGSGRPWKPLSPSPGMSRLACRGGRSSRGGAMSVMCIAFQSAGSLRSSSISAGIRSSSSRTACTRADADRVSAGGKRRLWESQSTLISRGVTGSGGHTPLPELDLYRATGSNRSASSSRRGPPARNDIGGAWASCQRMRSPKACASSHSGSSLGGSLAGGPCEARSETLLP